MKNSEPSTFIYFIRRFSTALSFVFLVVVFLIIIFWNSVVRITPVGHVSVMWNLFTIERDQNSKGPIPEGIRMIWPWDQFFVYDIRLRSENTTYQVVSKDGLHFNIGLTFRWAAVEENIVELNDRVGPNYVDTLLVPEIGSVARQVIARYTSEALITEDRSHVEQQIYDEITSPKVPNGISGRDPTKPTQAPLSLINEITGVNETTLVVLTDTLIREVEFPPGIVKAIEDKLAQAQVVGEYAFRVEREKLESQRKKIEADGIRNFQETIAPAISESYLKWRGIEATVRLAESNNSKIVIFGNSDDGLPVILDMENPLPDALPKSPDHHLKNADPTNSSLGPISASPISP
jgi:regulator of protease activity HflC (stomatin/prohibitin superfamily)